MQIKIARLIMQKKNIYASFKGYRIVHQLFYFRLYFSTGIRMLRTKNTKDSHFIIPLATAGVFYFFSDDQWGEELILIPKIKKII